MSSKPGNILNHPIELFFMGRAGARVIIYDQAITDKGFVVHGGVMQTSEPGSEDVLSTPIRLITPKDEGPDIVAGNFYFMTCKLIASNDSRPDQLHFNDATRLDATSVSHLTPDGADNTVNRISIKALGTIIAKVTTQAMLPSDRPTVVITLKSVDVNPIDGSPVVWITKHRIPSPPSMECAKRLWDVGSDVHLSGVVVGYDDEAKAWISEVSCLQACTASKETPSTPTHVGRGRSNARRSFIGRVSRRNFQHVIRAYNAGLRGARLRAGRGRGTAPGAAKAPTPQRKDAHSHNGAA